MRILNYLCEDCIEPAFEASSKEAALKRLAELAVKALDGIDAEEIFEVLLEREELGTTAIGCGFAIPHGKISKLNRLSIIVARSKEGVPFDSLDGEPVFVIFLLLAPDDATPPYLRILARISRMLKSDENVIKLKNAGDSQEIRQIIEHAEDLL